MLPLHAAGGRAERDGAGSSADRQPTEARPAPARGGQHNRVGPHQTAAGAETEGCASGAREGGRDARHK